MPSEQDFIRDAMALMHELVGDAATGLGPDTELQSTGWFDSLLLVTFLDFIETQRGAPLPISADTGIPVDDLVTIRKAYHLVNAPA